MKLLLAVGRYPWPPRRGDRLRTHQTIRLLLSDPRRDAHVTLLAPEPSAGDAPPSPELPVDRFRLVLYPRSAVPPPTTAARVLTDGWPVQSALFARPALGRAIALLAREADAGLLQLVRMAPHREDFGALPVTVDLIDSLALNFERRAAHDRPGLRPLLRFEARRLARAEGRLLEAGPVTLVSSRDLAVVRQRHGSSRGSVVPLLMEPEAAPAPPPSGPPTVALTGNLGYFPNRDAALWWLREVVPTLRARRPELDLLVAGARPPRAVRRAAAEAGARLVASPPDLRELLRRATVAVAPLRAGSGVPVKVLEAWALGVPMVASPWAAAGTEGVPGEDLRVAREPGEWVDHVLELVDDPAARRRLAAAGRARLAADYSAERVRDAWWAVLGS